jgi:ABC-type transport system substrate-binding protein
MSKLVTSPKFLILVPLLVLLALAAACGGDATPQVIEKEVIKEVPVDKVVIKEVEVIKEVPIEKQVVKEVEVIKEVEVEKEVIKEVEVIQEVEVEKEVIKEVEVVKEVEVEKEVIKRVVIEVPTTKEVEVIKEVEVVKEVEKEVQVVLVATPTPTIAPVKVTAKVETLMVSYPTPFQEANTGWDQFGSENTLSIRHMMDTLLSVDPFSSKIIPGLVTDYEMVTPDAKSWRVKLRKGVQFHNGWGEFTAEDVPHSIALLTQSEAVNGFEQRRMGEIFGNTQGNVPDGVIEFESPVFDNIEVVNDHELIFNILTPRPDFDFIMVSRNGSMFMYSKDYWVQEGGMTAYRNHVIGTGSWKFVKRELGQYLEMEATTNHWRKTPGFPRIRTVFQREDATRLAALLTGEVHMAALPRTLYTQARSAGMVVHTSTAPSDYVIVGMGGVYRKDHDYYDPTVPFLDIRVREAVNRALNRDEIIDELFLGGAQKAFVNGFHPTLEAWNPDWQANFEKDYGYDVEKAKALIADAGYAPGEIKVKTLVTSIAALPDAGAVGETLAIYLDAIGIDAEIFEIEFSAFVPYFREGRMHNVISVWASAYLPPIEGIRIWSWSLPKGSVALSETEFMDENYPKYRASLDATERETLLRSMGNYRYDNYLDVPLVWVFADIIADPNIVSSVTFPGGILGTYGEWAYTEPTPK